jgi:hypothetical protein
MIIQSDCSNIINVFIFVIEFEFILNELFREKEKGGESFFLKEKTK